jgi:hypothetical protein
LNTMIINNLKSWAEEYVWPVAFRWIMRIYFLKMH